MRLGVILVKVRLLLERIGGKGVLKWPTFPLGSNLRSENRLCQ